MYYYTWYTLFVGIIELIYYTREGGNGMFQLDSKSRKSIYEQVVDNIKEMILSKVLRADEKLPSVRDLSGTLTINPNTVQKAYKELERLGYVYSMTGLGTFVSKIEEGQIDEVLLLNGKQQMKNSIRELYYAGLGKDEIMNIMQEILNTTERGGAK